jgi:hypothetical protein
MAIVNDSTGLSVYENSARTASTRPSAGTNQLTGVTVGAAYDGTAATGLSICELAIYAGALGPAQLRDAMVGLGAYYGRDIDA